VDQITNKRCFPKIRSLAILIIVCAILACVQPLFAASAEQTTQEIPKESLAKIQDVFARTTNHLWEKSDDFYHDGYFERSIAVTRLIAEIDPTDDQAYSVGSWLMDSKGREAEGIAYLELGLSRNQDRYEMYAELGFRYDHMNDYAKSAYYFEQASKHTGFPVMLWHMLAHAYEKSGQLEKALKTWEHSAELQPGDAVVKNNLERVRTQLDEEKSKAKGGESK
jgi:tetratricopeptide (TPR) repeat protein